jgi:hypothetical protein
MKNDHLLEAIGFVEEQFLREAESAPKHKVHPVRRIALVAAVIGLLVLTAMASTGILKGLRNAGENGATMENLSSSTGNFVYHNGSVYHGTFGYIHEYDLEGNILKTYPLSNKQERPCYMFVSEEAILYTAGVASMELSVQPKDGSDPYTVEFETGVSNAYADGQVLYTIGEGAILYGIDLVTMEKTELLEDVASYYVDDTYIYAVQTRNGKAIYRSTKDEIRFEPLPLDFVPNKVVAHGESLYICRWLDADEQKETGHRYGISLIEGNDRTNLPVYSWLYQVVGDRILYLEEGTNTLKYYDRKTEETGSLAENVFTFSVFADRYICIEGYNEAPKVYDMTTGICNEVTIEQP